MQNKDSELAAIFETVLGHIDLNERKIVDFPDDKLEHILNIYNAQKAKRDISFEIKLHIKDIDE